MSTLTRREKPVFEGEVLVCEDDIMNRQAMCSHLAHVGLRATVASDGSEGVEAARRRMVSGKPPFDLIFMDVHMPVMDGIEAARWLARMGNTAPVVALTASAVPNGRDVYREAGLPDCISKPFTVHELWACLLKYLTPVTVKSVDAGEQSLADEKMHRQLLKNFWEDNQTTFNDIVWYIDARDIRSAHRLAHRLGGIAGLIGRGALRDAARAVEESLRRDGAGIGQEPLNRLDIELNLTMSELASIFDRREAGRKRYNNNVRTFIDKTEALNLIRRLEPMFKTGDSDSLDFIDGLRAIPETGALISRMERFDFAAAGEMLAGIRQGLELAESA